MLGMRIHQNRATTKEAGHGKVQRLMLTENGSVSMLADRLSGPAGFCRAAGG